MGGSSISHVPAGLAVVTIHVEHNAPEVEREILAIPPRLDRALSEGVEEGTQILRTFLIAEVVRRTSMDLPTAERIVESELSGGRGEVSFTRPHPYTIRARNAAALSFIWNGQRVFFRSVRHPGSRPYKLVGVAGEHSERLVGENFERKVAEVLGVESALR